VTEQALFILAVLADGPRHGYAIAAETRDLSGGRVELTAGTLYGALNLLSRERLIRETSEETVEGRRRRYYELTSLGATRLSDEAEKLRASAAAIGPRVTAARRRGLEVA
jgi:PadR family transcriptional regulator PadR